jgi:alpha-tubulin suppressor-like RCC1 family protein
VFENGRAYNLRISKPTLISNDTWSSFTAKRDHTFGIKTTGTLWAWGKNFSGVLGTGNEVNQSSPVQIGSGTDWSSIGSAATTDRFTVAIKTNGSLWTWGLGTYGRLGSGNNNSRSSPVQVGTDTNWASTSSSPYHTLAVKTNGTLWAWGRGAHGQLGNDSFVTRSSPVQIGSDSNWASVSAGGLATNDAQSFAVKTTGTLWAWGNNNYGKLGLGTLARDRTSSPVQVGTDTNWSLVGGNAGFGGSTIAVKTTGTLWVWGRNNSYHLGLIYSYVSRFSPTQQGTDSNWATASMGYLVASAIRTTGTLWTWGSGSYGSLGNGTAVTVSSPVQVGTQTDWSKVSAANRNCAAIKTTGTLWTWGRNTYGQLGLGNTTSRSSPVQVGTGTDWASVSCGISSHVCAVKTGGTLWAWGRNNFGQLGLGDTTNRSSPVQVGTGTDWASVNCNYASTLAIKTNGTLWAWGLNAQYQLGLGNTTNRSSPVQVGTDTNWSKVSSARFHTIGLKTTGTLWAWGRNTGGELGLGNVSNRSAPTQIGSKTDWSNIGVGTSASFGINTSGKLYAFGLNSGYGRLGIQTFNYYNSPKQVGTATDWSSVSTAGNSTMARKTTGTLWGWGRNNNGQLGLGDATTRSSPVQVGTGTDWSKVSIGRYDTKAIKTGGTLWAWGFNSYGGLGTSDTTNRSSPVQVGSATNWNDISSAYNHNMAKNTSNLLYGMGRNGFSEIIRFTNHVSSPVQVGTSSNWSTVVISRGAGDNCAAIETT